MPTLRLRLLLVLAVAASQLAAPAAPAEATNPHTNCRTTVAKIYWDNDWPTELIWDAKVGAGWWERDRHWLGTKPAIDVSHVSYSQKTVGGDYDWELSSSTWGHGLCTTKKFVINSRRYETWRQNSNMLRTAVAHELGHVLGTDHVGKQDSFDGNVPLMATCRSYTYYAQDDGAFAQSVNNRSGTYRNMTANSSFENGSRYWGRSGISSLQTHNGGVDGSSRALRLNSSSTTSYIYSTTRVHNAYSQIDWIKARANYRRVSSTHRGTVSVVLRVGRTTYPRGETCGTPDINGGDGRNILINDGTRSTNWTHYYSKTCTPSGSWGYCTTSGMNPDSSYDAANARVYLYNRMRTSSGGLAPVLADRVRIMVDF